MLWPIRELTGEVVGFGARKLDPDEDGPKYLNSPESPIFHKGRILYGLDLTNRDIARRLHLAEGTVRNYLSAAMAKLDARNRTEAAKKARERGWL